MATDGWRPPQWTSSPGTSLTATDDSGKSTLYVFDAVVSLRHREAVQATSHPVQGKANIYDHAYELLPQLVMEIGMSDAMDRYSPDLFTSDASKSVSAWNTLLALKAARRPLTVVTRLKTYDAMLIVDMSTQDTHETTHGLRARVVFQGIISATVTSTQVSALPNATDEQPVAPVACHKPSSIITKSNTISETTSSPGAGSFSSLSSTYDKLSEMGFPK